MRRVLVFAFLIGGSWLLGMVGVLSNTRREEAEPAWIYVSGVDDLYRMRPDGSQLRRVMSEVSSISFSLDGKWIYYSSNGQIFRRTLYGHRTEQLTAIEEINRLVYWSLDGRWFLFTNTSLTDGSPLYRMSSDGRDLQRLTTNSGGNTFLAMSPDNQWIYYNLRGHLHRMRPDGTGEDQLDAELRNVGIVGWTLDHKWLVFTADARGGYRHIHRMDTRTRTIDQITYGDQNHSVAAWLPECEMIILSQWISNAYKELYQLNLNSSGGMQRMFEGNGSEYFVSLTPNRDSMIFASPQNGRYTLNRYDFTDGTIETLTESLHGTLVYRGNWISNNECLIYEAWDDFENANYTYISCFNDGHIYRYGTAGKRTVVRYWSANDDWGIVNQYTLTPQTNTLYRIELHSERMLQISPPFDIIGFVGASPIFDLAWSAVVLVMVGIGMIGGGLCVGYWFSRS